MIAAAAFTAASTGASTGPAWASDMRADAGAGGARPRFDDAMRKASTRAADDARADRRADDRREEDDHARGDAADASRSDATTQDATTAAAAAATATPVATTPSADMAGLQAMIAAMAGATLPANAGTTAAATPPGGIAAGRRGEAKGMVAATATDASIDLTATGPDALAADAMPGGVAVADARNAVAALASDAIGGATDGATAGTGGGAAISAADVAVTHQLDLAKDGAWLDSLARDIARSADANGQLRFSLAPEALGKLDVQLSAQADGTAIRLTAETREAHRIIADAQPQLVAEARAQGLRISETHVDLNGSGGGDARSQGFGNQNGGGGNQPEPVRRQPMSSASAPAVAAVGATGDDDLYA